jgi:hypothetical protein
MPYPRLRKGSSRHLQHLAGLAWRDGNIDEAERLEALARLAEISESDRKPSLGRCYNRGYSEDRRLVPLDEPS